MSAVRMVITARLVTWVLPVLPVTLVPLARQANVVRRVIVASTVTRVLPVLLVLPVLPVTLVLLERQVPQAI